MGILMTGEFSSHSKFSMLIFLIALYALIGVQGKAFPSRYKRHYEGGYHYIPYEEGIVHIPAGYSPESLPNYQDYVHGYVQSNGHDWSAYYQQMHPQPIEHPYSNINSHHKMKAKHTWHFIDQSHAPVTRYSDGIHQFESGVETPNVVEALVKKDVIDGHSKYEAPIFVETLIPKGQMDHADSETPVAGDSSTAEESPLNYNYRNTLVTEPIVSYYPHEPIKEEPVKEKPIKEKPIKEKPIKEKPIKEKPIKEKPILSYESLDYPLEFDTLNIDHEHETPVVEALMRKEMPTSQVIEEEHELPIVVEALVRKLPVVDSLAKKNKPIEVEPVVSYGAFQLPILDSLTKEDKYVKVKPVSSYGAFELPVIVDSLKPIKIEPIVSYGSSKMPIADSLTKKDKPIKVGTATSYAAFEIPLVDSLTNKDKHAVKEPISSYSEFELPDVVESLTKKDKPIAIKPDASYGAFELPMVDTLTKKDKPIKVGTAASYGVFELPFLDSLTKKDKPFEKEPVFSYDSFELPVVVDSLSKKDEPIMVETDASYNMEKPIKEKPIKEKPIKEKPIKEKPILAYESLDYPLEFDTLNIDHEHKTPAVVEALIRKEMPASHMGEEYELPLVVEALVRKHPPVYESKKTKTEEDKLPPKDFLQSVEESILTKENAENVAIPVVEALTFEQDTENKESPNSEGITSDVTQVFNEVEMDSFDENGDQGSAMDFDRSRFARSFLPVNSNIFSMTNIQEQERRKFKNCVTPKNETGRCMPFQQCSVSSAVVNIDELLRNVCIIDEVFIGVCCPEFPVETVRVDWELLQPDSDMPSEEKSSQISKECGRLSSRVTDQDSWPWMASLIAKSSEKIFCGGALISEQYVLTAAHCTIRIPRNQILVRLGGPASETLPEPDFEVIEIKRHAGYNRRTMQNDIALLKLSRRVQLGDFRRVVCLAKDEEGIEDLVSKSSSLLRWKETPGEIKDVESLAVISPQECQSRMRTMIADSILCTEPRTDETMCNADSGAPLIMAKEEKFEVIGILTWNRNDCDERFPAVFTRVSSYHRWIEKLAS